MGENSDFQQWHLIPQRYVGLRASYSPLTPRCKPLPTGKLQLNHTEICHRASRWTEFCSCLSKWQSLSSCESLSSLGSPQAAPLRFRTLTTLSHYCAGHPPPSVPTQASARISLYLHHSIYLTPKLRFIVVTLQKPRVNWISGNRR